MQIVRYSAWRKIAISLNAPGFLVQSPDYCTELFREGLVVRFTQRLQAMFFLFEHGIELVDEGHELVVVLLSYGLTGEFLPTFFFLALHGERYTTSLVIRPLRGDARFTSLLMRLGLSR